MKDFLNHLQQLLLCGAVIEDVLTQVRRSCDRHIPPDDFNQSVLLRAIEHRASFRGETIPELLGWLQAIGQQLAAKLRVSSKRLRQAALADLADEIQISEAEREAEEAEQAVETSWLNETIAGFSKQDQSLLRRHYWADESLVAFARRRKLSPNTVTQRHCRLLQRLRALARLRSRGKK